MMTIQSMRLSGRTLHIQAELATPAIRVSEPDVQTTEGSVDVFYTTTDTNTGYVAQVLVQTELEVALPEGAEVGPRAYHVHVNGALAQSIRTY